MELSDERIAGSSRIAGLLCVSCSYEATEMDV